MSSSRAGLPTTTSPPGAIDTTLGTNLSPSSPGIILGPVRSMNATKLLVVPRSIPTICPDDVKSISMLVAGCWLLVAGFERLLNLGHEVEDVLATVQHIPDLSQYIPRLRRVVFHKQRRQFLIGRGQHTREILLGL